MIIKLDTSIFGSARDLKIESTKHIAEPLTHQQKVVLDRIVIAVLFLVVIVGAILF